MVYLTILQNQIKLFAITKTILNQYNISSFSKKYESDLLENNVPKNTDLLASAIREALSQSTPKETKDRDITLILPSAAFEFARYSIPKDLSESAILPFVKDKTRATFDFNVEETANDFIITQAEQENEVLFFAQKLEVFAQYEEVFKLLGLNIKTIIPDSLCFYKLFEKTLKLNKKENIIYAFYDDEHSYGYLYNSQGLINPEKIILEGDFQEALKQKVTDLLEENIKVNRIILSGPRAENIRQDLFTKKVGAWTNPLKKIVPDFYAQYLKMFIVSKEVDFSFMTHDGALGAFIFNIENPNFSLVKKSNGMFHRVKATKAAVSKKSFFTTRDVVVFLGTLTLTIGAVIGLSRLGETAITIPTISLSKPSPTITPAPISPTSTPTPTPAFKKEDVRIEVYNGSGVVGKAGQVVAILKNLGYSESLNKGNADKFDYDKTLIEATSEKIGLFDMLAKDLSGYTISPTKQNLDKTSVADVVITIGQDWK